MPQDAPLFLGRKRGEGDRSYLLRGLGQHQETGIPVMALPAELRNPDLLTVNDADGLIEFGKRKHCHVGDELHLENGWYFNSVTGPQRKPIVQWLVELEAEPADSPIRTRIRLTFQGRIEASRLILSPTANNRHRGIDSDSPQAISWQDALKQAESHVKAHDGVFPSVKRLAKIIGCSRPTIDKAISNSTYLKARQAESKRGGREQPMTDNIMDCTAQTTEDDPSNLATLMDEQAAEMKREERQNQAYQQGK